MKMRMLMCMALACWAGMALAHPAQGEATPENSEQESPAPEGSPAETSTQTNASESHSSQASTDPASSSQPSEPDSPQLAEALRRYLAKQGDLCLGKFEWPITVSNLEVQAHTSDAMQMPVLERMGLVKATSTVAADKVPAKRYDLTRKGRSFYVVRETSRKTSDGQLISHHGDLCAGKLKLDKVVARNGANPAGNQLMLSYTYTFTPADWARDPEVRKVFPMIERIIQGAGTLQLTQLMRSMNGQWEAVNPFG